MLDPETTDLVERFSNHQRLKGFRERTIERRSNTLSLFSRQLNGASLLGVVSADIERFLARYPVAASRHGRWSDLNQFYRFAIRRHLADNNPVDDIDPPRVPHRAASPIAVRDVRLLVQLTAGRTRLMILLYAQAGLRASEIARLRGEHTLRDERLIIVRDGKGGTDDTVTMSRQLHTELNLWPSKGALFPGATRHTVYDVIKAAMRRHSIDGRPHDLRHSFLTNAARVSKGNMRLVQRMARHRTIRSTERYVNWYPPGADIIDDIYGGDAA